MARIKLYRILRDNSLIIATCVAVIAALVLGFCLRGQQWTERQIMYLAFPGDIFLRMLKCMILPLIVASMVSSVGSLDSKATGRIGRWALLYYFGTTVCAIVLGIVLVCVIGMLLLFSLKKWKIKVKILNFNAFFLKFKNNFCK